MALKRRASRRRGDILNKLTGEIIRIIRRAIDRQNEEVDPNAPWGLIFKIGQLHNIIPVLYEGISHTNIDSKTKAVFAVEYRQKALVHYNQTEKLASITNAFDKQGIDYAILKGERLKSLYPKPEMRPMADLDILIKLEQYDKIKECLASLGLTEKEQSDHEIIWTDNRFVYLELHKRLIPSYNVDLNQYFGTGWGRARRVNPNGGCHQFSAEDELVFLFAHFAKHYRDGGIGIRHILDLYLFEKNHLDMDMNYIKEELEKLGLFKFYKNIVLTIDNWFRGGPELEVTELITERIFKSGAYGTLEAAHAANAVKVANRYKTAFLGRIAFVIKSLFPPIEVVREKYPILAKVPVLLPFCWVLRAAKGALFKRNTLNNEISKLKSIDKKTISSYKAELDRVGLDNKFR